MKALMKTKKGVGNIELVDVAEPQVNTDDVKIEVKAAGICGTDIHIYYDEFPNHPPFILGHEFSGEVVEVGKNVKNISVGDRVTLETSGWWCNNCKYCRAGDYQLCVERRGGVGTWLNGGFAKYCVVRKEILHRLPDNISYDEGALCAPLAEATHGAAIRTEILPGEFVLVSGPGPIGLLAFQVAQLKGGTVVLSGTERDKLRLEVAKKIGADRTVNIEKEDLKSIVMEYTGGYGADVILECSGAQSAAQMGLELVRKEGKYTQMGLFGKPVSIDMDKIPLKQIVVNGFFAQNWRSWDIALKLLELGKVNLKPLITHKFPLNQWKEAFKLVEEKEGVKVLLVP